MSEDAITKRLKSTVLFMMEAREQLDDGDVGAMFEQADLDDYNKLRGLRDRVFELFGLDPKKPHDHQVLLSLLIHIIFGKGRAGAPKKWREFGQRPSPDQLKADIATVRARKSVRKSDRETTRILLEDKDKRFDGRYANIKPEALRHMVRKIK
jgi:hypothetical protein